MMTIFKIESAQLVSDTFCDSVPQKSRKLQLEHHPCIRLLKAVYGLVNAPRRWYHRVATDLRNMRGEESVIDPGLWTFRDENGVIHALCLVYVDDFILACSDSPFGKHVFESINNLYEWGKWESRVFKQCGAQITQTYNKHTGTWGGFEISFAKYLKEISIITLPSHRRRDKKSRITPLELSQLRAMNGQLLWLGMRCLPQLLAPLSLLMGQTPQATVGPNCEVNKLARKATAWHAHHSLFVVTYTDAGWTTRPDGTSQGGQLVFIANFELLQGRESNMSVVSWHSSRLRRARSSSAAETQAAADGDDEAFYTRLCLKEVLFGQLDLRNWQSETRQIPVALLVDCRGVYDALGCFLCSCLGLKDKKSGLEALALKQSLVECGTIIRWCHSPAQLGVVVTKDSDAARAPWELFVHRGFRWKLMHDPKFESSRNRAKRGLDTLDEPDENEFADDVPRDPKSVTLIT